MKYITNSIKIGLLLAFSVLMILSSCNKAPEQIPGPAYVAPPSGLALGDTLATIATDSLYYRLVVKGGMLSTINNRATVFTMFVPDNNAMKAFINFISGGAVPLAAPDAVFSGFIQANIPAATAASIVSYNICPQAITTASIPSTFPNWFYPTNLNPTTGTPAFNPLVRLTTSPSTRNGNWVNNVPLSAVNANAANGIIHTAAALPAPPSRYLWNRISTDPDLTYMAAAFQRADSGVAPVSSASLIWVLNNFGPNITVFAPSNAAFQGILTALITQALVAQGVPLATAQAMAAALASSPAVFSNPALYGSLTAQTVKGILVYHILGSRAFTNNFPTTTTYYPTLLNTVYPTHPGVGLTCTIPGPLPFVMTATVKGVANATAANIAINPLPDPYGTSDQHFVNGTLHKINQVLLPQ